LVKLLNVNYIFLRNSSKIFV